MLSPEQLDEMTAALMRHDASLTEDEAGEIAADIGDTPFILDGQIQTARGGAAYTVPENVLSIFFA